MLFFLEPDKSLMNDGKTRELSEEVEESAGNPAYYKRNMKNKSAIRFQLKKKNLIPKIMCVPEHCLVRFVPVVPSIINFFLGFFKKSKKFFPVIITRCHLW